MSVEQVIALVSALSLAILTPGPSIIATVQTAFAHGRERALPYALGLAFGASLWCIFALAGLAVLFKAAPWALWTLKVVGGAYLLWMGWKLWKHAPEPFLTEDNRPLPRSPLSAFRLGLVTQLANPKPAVMFSAIFLGTVTPGTPIWIYIALLVVVFCNETLWNTLVARIFSLERTRAGYISLKTVIDRAFGGMLALLGLKIAAT